MRLKKFKHFKLLIIVIIILSILFYYTFYKQASVNLPFITQKKYNVIFFAFDGLQSKHLSRYGYNLDLTPNLDTVLDSSYLFTQAISPSSWTIPTYMSIFTSLYPSEHKLVNKFTEFDKKAGKIVQSNLKVLSPDVVTLALLLKEKGYQTAAFTGDAGVSSVYGYNLGFDQYYDGPPFGGFSDTIPRSIEWLKKRTDKPFFLFIHGYDVHGQYAPEEGFDYRFVKKPYRGKYTGSKHEQGALREEGLAKGKLNLTEEDVLFWRAIYDEKINRADEEFKLFWDTVNELNLNNNTVFVIFSDHGTEIYEHGTFDHGHTLYSELLNVLLAIKLPHQTSGKRINSLVSTIDVIPTLLSILKIKHPNLNILKGADLTPAFHGADVSHPVYSETDYRLYTHKRSVQTPDGWKFILTLNGNSRELYNLKDDSNELNNLAESEPTKTYELEQDIFRHLKKMGDDNDWTIGCLPVYADQCQ